MNILNQLEIRGPKNYQKKDIDIEKVEFYLLSELIKKVLR